MAYSLKSLALNDEIAGTSAGSSDTLYTATNVIAQIDMATAYNSSVSAEDIYIYVLPSGVAATSVNPVSKVNVAANSTAILSQLIGHKVPAGGSVQAYAGTTAVISVTISGGEQN